MTPLSGDLEWKMRARCATGSLFERDLIAALGVSQMNAYIKAYGPPGEQGLYDDKLNKAAGYAAQPIGWTPAVFAQSGYVRKGEAEIVGGVFWWTAKVMGVYAQYAKPQTRQGAS